jgi:hypothetical protein
VAISQLERRNGMARRLSMVLLALALVASLDAVPASAQTGTTVRVGTWEGQVVRHLDHFDYEGLPCTVDQDICIQILVRYRIVPVTDQAAKALPDLEGKRARLEGALHEPGDGEHAGILYVRRVSRA